MTQVTPFLKDKGDCPCGCGAFGTFRVRAWTDGKVHTRNCRCRRCMGSRHRKNSGARERRIAKRTGGSRVPLSGQGGGADICGRVDIEETAKVSLTRGLFRWWDSKQIQDKTANLYSRAIVPRAFFASRRGTSLVVMTADDFYWLLDERNPEESE